MKEKPLLIRFRAKDSKEGVTRTTMKKIAGALDLSETQAVHRALVEYASRFVPRYAVDEGPLTAEQHAKIAREVRKKHGHSKVTESLFDSKPTPSRARANKSISPSRAR